MTLEELKIRQLAGQHLLEPADYRTVARDLCGLQAQFLSNAFHALKIRSVDFQEEDPAGLVKNWTIRGTMHVFDREDLPLFLHRDRDRFLRPCDTLEADEYITRQRKHYFAELIVDSIAAGVDTREALKERCFQNGLTEREAESVFNAWGGTIRALCESGRICHQVREKKAFCLCPPFQPMEEETARLALARRYFTHYGPATVRDGAYFFGTTQAQVKAWLSQLPVETVEWGGRTYYDINTGEEPSGEIPDCLFLAGFDPLMLGYEKKESLYLPREHLRKIFNLAGIVMPAVLLRGTVVGKWKRKGMGLEITLFEALSPEDKRSIEDQAYALWPHLRQLRLAE